jgi:nucleotidyltransferase/DNA polymerase involved in DNA repair
VHAAMPMRLALRMCPDAVVVKGDHDLYSYYSNMVTEIISLETPVVEKASIDEHYLDVSNGPFLWMLEMDTGIAAAYYSGNRASDQFRPFRQ